jgi:acetate kinase
MRNPGCSACPRVERHAHAARERCAFGRAVELFAYRVAREMAALAGVLGGVDTLVFTAGVGEHAPRVRELICARAAWLGIAVDAARTRPAAR